MYFHFAQASYLSAAVRAKGPLYTNLGCSPRSRRNNNAQG
jgi:hypothetical protein